MGIRDEIILEELSKMIYLFNSYVRTLICIREISIGNFPASNLKLVIHAYNRQNLDKYRIYQRRESSEAVVIIA